MAGWYRLHRVTDSPEMKQSGIEGVADGRCGVKDNKIFPVAMRLGVTPVPIPNTMVKTQAADGTLLETARESRWLPELKKVLLVI